MKVAFPLFATVLLMAPAAPHAEDIRIGITGLDPTHRAAFAKAPNDPDAKKLVPDGHISTFHGIPAELLPYQFTNFGAARYAGQECEPRDSSRPEGRPPSESVLSLC